MLFFIVHDVPDGSACAPGTVSASARRKSLRTGLTPSGASKGCASIPVRGVCSSCMPTTKPSGPRSCCWRWPLRNSLPGMSPCAAKTSPSQPEGRVGGLFSAISLSGRSCRFSSGWPRRWRPPFPLSSKGLRRCAVGASVWMSLMPPPSAFPCCAVTSKRARLLTLLLGFGEALEAWTRKKSLDTLAQSLALDVDTVWVRREGPGDAWSPSAN